MERIQTICSHHKWLEAVSLLQVLEQDRIFCSHTVEHFLDVARIAYVEDLEKGLGISKALIYAAALLHDIGRARQYLDGTPHDQAGAALSREILSDCGFSEKEQENILSAISAHRDPNIRFREDLAGLLYRADKASRMCLFCGAKDQCNWPEEKKNMYVTI